MLAGGHMAVAATVTLATAEALAAAGHPVSPGQVLAATALAMACSRGKLSPDADQSWLAMFGHRYAVHWWGWPVAAAVALLAVGAPFVAFGPVLGWGSHIWPADWLFGGQNNRRGIPKGIPRWPWKGSPRHGTGWSVTRKGKGHSVAELAATGCFGLAALAMAWDVAHWPGLY